MTTTAITKKASDTDVARAVESTHSVSAALRSLGISPTGKNHSEFLRRISRLNIDTSHFKATPSRKGGYPKPTPEERLVRLEPGSYRVTAKRLREALIATGVPYRCAGKGCSVEGTWLGKPIILQVEHIDGDGLNNEKENLCFLCANCHTQTSTFAGNKNRVLRTCTDCGAAVTRQARTGRCKLCAVQVRTKVLWPSNQELLRLLKNVDVAEVSRQLGVSYTGLRKHLVKINQG